MRIFIDSDTCPVKDEIIQIAQEYQIKSYFVSTFNQLFIVKDNTIFYQWVIVDDEVESVDSFIARNIQQNDVVITQNYNLASTVINKGAKIITNRGRLITEDNIEFLYFMKKIKNQIISRNKRMECFSAMQCEDRTLFSLKLIELINTIKKEGNLI